jgi:hypothetical protein
LPNEVGQVEVVAGKDVVFAEDVGCRAGFEPLFDVKVNGKPHVVEAAGARAEDHNVDRPAEIESFANPADLERDGGRRLELVRLEWGNVDGLAHLELAAGGQNAPDIDRLRHFSRFPEVKTTLQ